MSSAFAKKYFLYGLLVAGLEEFLTQGVLKQSYFVWIFTLIPFAVFLGIAACLWAILRRMASDCVAVAFYYLSAGAIGLAVEWFLIGLAPWNDRSSPVVLIAIFHVGMFSFWGSVALAPRILLDSRPHVASLRHRFVIVFAACGCVTYMSTFAAKIVAADQGLQFLATIGPVVLTFLAMNVFYIQYVLRCREVAQTRGTPRRVC